MGYIDGEHGDATPGDGGSDRRLLKARNGHGVSLFQGRGIGGGGWKAEADTRRPPLGAAAVAQTPASQDSSSIAASAALVSSKNRSLWAIRISRGLLRKLEVPRENSANASPVPWAVEE